jgi:O-antigen ligase
MDPDFASNVQRFVIYSSVMKTIQNHWLLGVGYFQVFARSKQLGFVKIIFLHSHNILLQYLSEFGIFGFSLFSILLILYFVRFYNLLKRSNHLKSEDLLLFKGIGIGILGFLFTQSVDYTLHNQKVLYVFLLFFFLFMQKTKDYPDKQSI